MPRCKNCRLMFKATTFLQSFCRTNEDCLTAESQFAVKKLTDKKAKDWNKEKAVRKKALLSHSEWLNLLQVIFNTFIRLRDKNLGCISCGTQKETIKYDCGHFFSVGGFPNVRFDEDNCHRQCSNNCNVNLSGNIHEYRPRLIEKIGLERFEALEFRARNKSGKLSIPEIEEKIRYYKEKIKELK